MEEAVARAIMKEKEDRGIKIGGKKKKEVRLSTLQMAQCCT